VEELQLVDFRRFFLLEEVDEGVRGEVKGEAVGAGVDTRAAFLGENSDEWFDGGRGGGEVKPDGAGVEDGGDFMREGFDWWGGGDVNANGAGVDARADFLGERSGCWGEGDVKANGPGVEATEDLLLKEGSDL